MIVLMPSPPINEMLVAVLIGFMMYGLAISIPNRLYPLICDALAIPVTVMLVIDVVAGSVNVPVYIGVLLPMYRPELNNKPVVMFGVSFRYIGNFCPSMPLP